MKRTTASNAADKGAAFAAPVLPGKQPLKLVRLDCNELRYSITPKGRALLTLLEWQEEAGQSRREDAGRGRRADQ